MPYFGKTQTEVDDHGPISKKICYPNESDPITIALFLRGIYIVLHDGELYYADGKIAVCLLVEGLMQSKRFGQSETEVLRALQKRIREGKQ